MSLPSTDHATPVTTLEGASALTSTSEHHEADNERHAGNHSGHRGSHIYHARSHIYQGEYHINHAGNNGPATAANEHDIAHRQSHAVNHEPRASTDETHTTGVNSTNDFSAPLASHAAPGAAGRYRRGLRCLETAIDHLIAMERHHLPSTHRFSASSARVQITSALCNLVSAFQEILNDAEAERERHRIQIEELLRQIASQDH